MLGNLLKLGAVGWLATKAYGQLTQPQTAAMADIRKDMEVVSSDGVHVGTVDNLAIKLTRKDPSAHGVHHILPMDCVAKVMGGKVTLNLTGSEASQRQQAVLSNSGNAPSIPAPRVASATGNSEISAESLAGIR